MFIRNLYRTIVLLVLIFWVQPSQAGWLEAAGRFLQSCKTYLETEHALPRITRLKRDKNLRRTLDLLAFGATDARNAERFLDELQTLPFSERQKFLRFLETSNAAALYGTALTMLLKLALHDKKQWSDFLELEKTSSFVSYRFSPDTDVIIRMLTPMAHEYPEWIEQKAKLVPSNYRSENNPGYVKEKYLRRIYDLILKLNYPAPLFFAEKRSQGVESKTVYRDYLDWVNHYFEEPGRVAYSGESVLQTVSLIQNWLQNLPEPHNLLQLTLFGSFPNGKADLSKSDLDIDFTLPEERQKRPHRDLEETLNQLKDPLFVEILELFKTLSLRANPKISFIQLENELTFPGLVNSIAFRITARKIELLVYGNADAAESPQIYPL